MANPTDHLTAVRAALDLAAKATPGPWRYRQSPRWLTDSMKAHDIVAPALTPVARDMAPDDADLACSLRNAAPAIAALADECERLADLFDRIDTAFDQLRPAMADPFVAFVCATMHAAKDPAAPAPALLSDVPMGGDA